MSVQPIPPSTGPTTAGQLAARATQNDQALAAWLGDVEDRVETLESGSGTSGSGILNVSGTVNLDDVAGIREVYATASATVEGVALVAGDAAVFRYLAGAWTYMIVGEHTTWQTVPGAPPADTTAPTAGTLAVTGTGDAGTTRTLTVTGASDAGGLHSSPYRFSTNGGTTWSAYQTSNAYTTGALAAGTYQPRVMVRDAAGNTATASAADFTVAASGGQTLGAWTIVQGFTLVGDALQSNAADGNLAWREAESLANVDIRAQVTSLHTGSSNRVQPAIVLRYVDANNYHYVSWDSQFFPGSQLITCYKVEGGSHTVVQQWTDATIPKTDDYWEARVLLSGTTLSVYSPNLPGAPLTPTATVPDNGSLKVGLRKGGLIATTKPWSIAVF